MIFIRRLLPEALQMEIPLEQGFHGSLAHFYGPFNHEKKLPEAHHDYVHEWVQF